MKRLVIVRGGGDIATGTIYKLIRCGFQVLVLEADTPSAIRRNVAFSEAVYDGSMTIEGMTAYYTDDLSVALRIMNQGSPVIMKDPEGKLIARVHPDVVVDAILAKKNLGTNRQMAPVTIGLGPGFTAGEDVDAVIETMRGHGLGRVIYEGCALPNTGIPGNIAGFAAERVIHAPVAGILHNVAHITDTVKKGQEICWIETTEGSRIKVEATMDGLLRGLIREGYVVTKGFKIADIDPRITEYDNCFTISDKARCIAGGVLEALFQLDGKVQKEQRGIYADYAATSAVKPFSTLRKMELAIQTVGNAGRGSYENSLEASRILYEARESVNSFFEGDGSSQVVFTSGITESLNLAICGLVRPGDHVVSTYMEHNSVLRPLYRMQKEGTRLTLVRPKKGESLAVSVISQIQEDTRLVVMTHGSNVTGAVYDIRSVGKYCRERNILFVTDCAQTAGVYPVSMKKDYIDVLCFTAHKALHGIQGCGGMCIRKGVSIRALKSGGTGMNSFDHEQPERLPEHLEAGTANLPGIAALSGGLEWIGQIGMDRVREREQSLLKLLESRTAEIPGLIHYREISTEKERTAVFSFNIEGMDSAITGMMLEREYGIKTRTGAHCAPLVHEMYGTVKQGMVRVSLGYETTESEVMKIADAIAEIALQQRMRQR